MSGAARTLTRLEDVLAAPGLFAHVAHQIGLRGSCQLTAVSHSVSTVVGDTVATLARMAPSLFVIGGGHGPANTLISDVLRLRYEEGKWDILPTPMPSPRCGCAATAYDGFVYVLGGVADPASLDHRQLPLALADRFSIASGKWETLPNMSRPRYFHGAVSSAGLVCVVGGVGDVSNGTWGLDSVEAFDVNNARWMDCLPLKVPQRKMAAIAVNNCLYSFGGEDEGYRTLSHAHCMRLPCCNSWETLPEMSTSRSSATAVTLGDNIFVFGGYDNAVWRPLDSVESYSIRDRQWTTTDLHESMYIPRAGCVAFPWVHKGVIFVLGGQSQAMRATTKAEIFVVNWVAARDVQPLPPLPVARNHFCAVGTFC